MIDSKKETTRREPSGPGSLLKRGNRNREKRVMHKVGLRQGGSTPIQKAGWWRRRESNPTSL